MDLDEHPYAVDYWRIGNRQSLEDYGTCRTDEHPHTRCSRQDWTSLLDMWRKVFERAA